MARRGPLKDQSLRLLRERGVEVGTILDVGVLNGTPELMSAWHDRKHILFEPVHEFSVVIGRKYHALDYELHTVAVGEESGSVTLRIESNVEGMDISHSYMTPGAASDAPNRRSVPMVSLDDFLRDKSYSQPYLLKIDIDGDELKVIKGAAETLKKCSVVIVECPSHHLVARISAVQAAGFSLFDLVEPCYYDGVFWQCDAIFVRNDILADLFLQLKGAVVPGKYECFRLP